MTNLRLRIEIEDPDYDICGCVEEPCVCGWHEVLMMELEL